ncbi:MAG: hypothetical protein ACYCOR_00795 [Acidobacteriaceae bacterium]
MAKFQSYEELPGGRCVVRIATTLVNLYKRQRALMTPEQGSIVQELDLSAGATQIVWEADASGSDQYRALRLPSLYPGVRW